MAELRSRSSRATITATSFVNEYNWGDLKADPADWMRRYFDAFVLPIREYGKLTTRSARNSVCPVEG